MVSLDFEFLFLLIMHGILLQQHTSCIKYDSKENLSCQLVERHDIYAMKLLSSCNFHKTRRDSSMNISKFGRICEYKQNEKVILIKSSKNEPYTRDS